MTARPVSARRPGRLRACRRGAGGSRPYGRRPRPVRARFRLSEFPGVTAAPACAAGAAAASRALARAGLGHLGGHLALRGPAGARAADLARAAEGAVAAALRRAR
ncbi:MULTISPECIES: hypothetical protein [unclassified Streptomyces]|uniref:hypothetical protein n=1 Tax=unclassified Streptomyces TaxID=2593676 RepID=UPI002E37AAE6|nr:MULTISPECIES: hypothetical protein [unclassified Streptomyces]WUC63561.1 hypothetical protein OG861_04620 [Streptomyces sp. NBC_00539]